MNKRTFKTWGVIGAAIALGAVLSTATGLAQQQPAAPAQPDMSNVQINALHVQGNVWMLTGGGFNAAMSVGNDGVMLVDTMLAPLGDKLLAKVKEVSGNKPIRLIVNTHAHGDHVGGNPVISAAGARIVAGNFAAQVGAAAGGQAQIITHENTEKRMLEQQPAYPFVAMPTDTFFNEEKDIYFNGESVQLLYQPNAHTDGDIMVFFRKSDVVVTGDVYINTVFPIFMPAQGGSYQGILDALNNIIDLTIPAEKQEGGTYVIPGHGRLADEADVVDYRDMATIVRDRLLDAHKRNRTLDQVKAEGLLKDFEGRYGAAQGFWTTNGFLEAAYASLKPAAPAAPARGNQTRRQ